MYKGKGSGYKGRESGYKGRGRGSGYKGRRSGYKGRGSGYTGRGSGYKGRGSGYKGRGVGVRGGGIQHQEYIMTFNEVLNTIAHNRYTYSFVSFHQRTRFGLVVLANIEFDIIFLLHVFIIFYVVVHLGDYQA